MLQNTKHPDKFLYTLPGLQPHTQKKQINIEALTMLSKNKTEKLELHANFHK